MSIRNRTVTIIGGAAAATALAGAAAFAAVDLSPMPTSVAAMPGAAHMAQLDPDAVAEMQTMMNEGVSVGEMHRFMTEQGIDLGPMHGDMTGAGMNPGTMHRNLAPGR